MPGGRPQPCGGTNVTGGATVLTAIASATAHPTSVQPSRKLMTMIEPMLGTWRRHATMVGAQYAAIAIRITTISRIAPAALPPALGATADGSASKRIPPSLLFNVDVLCLLADYARRAPGTGQPMSRSFLVTSARMSCGASPLVLWRLEQPRRPVLLRRQQRAQLRFDLIQVSQLCQNLGWHRCAVIDDRQEKLLRTDVLVAHIGRDPAGLRDRPAVAVRGKPARAC
jgi:hypothetical protein